MDALKKKRGLLRTAFTKVLNNWNELLTSPTSSIADVSVAYGLLSDKHTALEGISSNVVIALEQDEDATDDEILKDLEECDAYKAKFLKAKFQFEERNAAHQSARNIETASATPIVVAGASSETRSPYKLPPIEIAKFNGSVRGWLQFWSLFKKIHENSKLNNEEKFQYLIQAMVPESRAAELVNSYPPTGDNYEKVIASLKNRFGRDDLQIEVYVRELLQLVLQNVSSSKEVQLSSLYDKIESHMRALETLGLKIDAAFLFPLVESALPEDLLRIWQRSNSAYDVEEERRRRADSSTPEVDESSSTIAKNRLDRLIQFLGAEVQNEMRISMAGAGFGLKGDADNEKSKKQKSEKKDVPSARSLLTKGQEKVCIFCEKSDHESAKCTKATSMPLNERQEVVKKKRACFNCLRIGHNSRFCRVNVKCSKCNRHHVDLMCYGEKKEAPAVTNTVSGVNLSEECNLATLSDTPSTFMQTLRIKLYNGINEVTARAIIDTGSQHSYVLKEIAEKLNYEPVCEQKLEHLLFGGQRSKITPHKKYVVHATSLDGSYRCNFQALDQDTICSDVPSVTKGKWLEELENLNVELSDVCSKDKKVQVLIGADIAGKLFTGRMHLLESGLTAIHTYLGWTLIGKVPAKENSTSMSVETIALLIKETGIENLWSLDVLGIRDPIDYRTRKQHDDEVVKRFSENVTKNQEGRYEVRLPWVECHPELKDNKSIAMKRLKCTTKKLQSADRYTAYGEIFQEWLNEGIIERVPPECEDSWGYYLPNRPVYKENSTTAIRPVFDPSSESEDYPALNKCLEKGPNLIELISSILLRFRLGKIGVIADIRKAFLQISISPADRDYLRFLWYDAAGNVVIYRHCRVVFGICSSPFILAATINLHLDNIIDSQCMNAAIDLENTKKLKESFYVDNCVTSVNSENELVDFMSNARAVMESGNFDLRAWEYTNDDGSESPSYVLGIMWDKKDDFLFLNVANLHNFKFEKITKRNILSAAHRVFDPLGFVAPVLLGPKILLQQAWAANISWDEEVDESIKNKFTEWVGELMHLAEVKIPRCIMGIIDETTDISLHTFCDASKLAYAAVIFLRIQRGLEVQVHFVQAKTRVAPTNKSKSGPQTSIPRLELLAATIGARLAAQTIEALDFKNVKTYYWSDSSTVVTWIQKRSNWSVFVANRVDEIRHLSDYNDWRHLPGHLKPADLPSRGCAAKQLITSRWWEGPDWLRQDADQWAGSSMSINDEEINAELRKSKSRELQCITLISFGNKEIFTADAGIFDDYSSYDKVLTVVGWLWRFIKNCLNSKNAKKVNFLTSKEYTNAESQVVKIIQRASIKSFEEEQIKQLNPFVDEHGVIRTKTRLLCRPDNFNFICPMILPENNHISVLIVREMHCKLNHAGVTSTMNALREKFWILGGRKVVRRIIKQCIDCNRHDAKPIDVCEAPLPLNRVRDAAVFEIVGVDFTGPIYLKVAQKAWICIFTCAVYRAIHLELVNSLSVASFLMALRRHIARHGRPSIIYSDNGTNFVGLNNQLKGLNYQKIAKKLAVQRIEWRFNPPSAPWWGGFWERLIGILKRLLRRTLKKSCLSYEEMITTLADCEAVINSRPITFTSEGHDEVVPLTPSMFIQEIKEVGVIDLDKIERSNLNKRFAYRQKLKRDLRQRFRNEYLGALKNKKHSKYALKTLKVGDVVLVGSDNLKRLDWPLARVKQLFTGKDGHVRVARLTTASGEITRPVQRIFPLELGFYNDDDSEVANIVENKITEIVNESKDSVKEVVTNVNEIKTRSGRISKAPERLNYKK